MNFFKKREDKAADKEKILSQNSHKIINNIEQFKKFTDWSATHEVKKG